ncbi:hypothetical protein Tco_0189846 [Tanacetum coccineum]
MMKMVTHCGDELVIEFIGGVFHFQAFAVKEESSRKMVMMRRMKVVEDLNNERDERFQENSRKSMKFQLAKH